MTAYVHGLPLLLLGKLGLGELGPHYGHSRPHRSSILLLGDSHGHPHGHAHVLITALLGCQSLARGLLLLKLLEPLLLHLLVNGGVGREFRRRVRWWPRVGKEDVHMCCCWNR